MEMLSEIPPDDRSDGAVGDAMTGCRSAPMRAENRLRFGGFARLARYGPTVTSIRSGCAGRCRIHSHNHGIATLGAVDCVIHRASPFVDGVLSEPPLYQANFVMRRG